MPPIMRDLQKHSCRWSIWDLLKVCKIVTSTPAYIWTSLKVQCNAWVHVFCTSCSQDAHSVQKSFMPQVCVQLVHLQRSRTFSRLEIQELRDKWIACRIWGEFCSGKWLYLSLKEIDTLHVRYLESPFTLHDMFDYKAQHLCPEYKRLFQDLQSQLELHYTRARS